MCMKLREVNQEFSAVYRIVNATTGKCYVGSAICVSERIRTHLRDLRQSQHNRKLQAAWDRYGEEDFFVEVLEICDPNSLLCREQHYLDILKSWESGYNVRRVANSNLGLIHTQETRRKMADSYSDSDRKHRLSESMRRAWSSPTSKMKTPNCTGRRHSKETLDKMRLSRKLLLQDQSMKDKNLSNLRKAREKLSTSRDALEIC